MIGENREDFTGKDLDRGHKRYFVFTKRTEMGIFHEKERLGQQGNGDFYRRRKDINLILFLKEGQEKQAVFAIFFKEAPFLLCLNRIRSNRTKENFLHKAGRTAFVCKNQAEMPYFYKTDRTEAPERLDSVLTA